MIPAPGESSRASEATCCAVAHPKAAGHLLFGRRRRPTGLWPADSCTLLPLREELSAIKRSKRVVSEAARARVSGDLSIPLPTRASFGGRAAELQAGQLLLEPQGRPGAHRAVNHEKWRKLPPPSRPFVSVRRGPLRPWPARHRPPAEWALRAPAARPIRRIQIQFELPTQTQTETRTGSGTRTEQAPAGRPERAPSASPAGGCS